MSRRGHQNRLALFASFTATSRLLVADDPIAKHNALEGSPAEDWLPPVWDATQVAKAMVKAFAILDRMPEEGSPRGIGSAWPEYRREFADAVGLPEDERLAREREQNRSRVPPSAIEITHMEAAFGWLERLRTVDPGAALCVQTWAYCRHRRLEWRRVCRRKRLSASTFFRKRSVGLESIANWLNRRDVAVF